MHQNMSVKKTTTHLRASRASERHTQNARIRCRARADRSTATILEPAKMRVSSDLWSERARMDTGGRDEYQG